MRRLIAVVVPLAAAACAPLAPLPDDTGFISAADPGRIASPPPRGPEVDHVRREVGAPGDWRGLNDEQAGS